MSTVSLKMSDKLLARLTSAARRKGMSRSAVVRDALESFLDDPGQGGLSAAAAAGDLLGSLSAPRDLSCDPKHMRGFGS
jgi:predicted transcriptional regulator